MRALSACSVRLQELEFKKVLSFAGALCESGHVKARLFLHHCLFNETPVRLRVTFQQGDLAQLKLGKVWVVEHEWAVLLQEVDPEDPFLPEKPD